MADDDRSRAGAGNVRRLVIVESPTKARKIAGYLGSNYIVESSRGHIRDLPRGAADVPAKYKSEAVGPPRRQRRRQTSNRSTSSAPTRRAPSPSSRACSRTSTSSTSRRTVTARVRPSPGTCWRRCKPRVPVKRMVFHEITEPAIRAAAENPRDLDIDLVDAQETRRILDRLYGYEVSPVLWKKVAPKLSAGRVQSVATRIIVQRERERMALPQRRVLGRHRRARRQRVRPAGRPAAVHREAQHRRRPPRWRPAATSTPSARSRSPTRCWCSTRPRRARWPAGLRGAPAGRRRRSEQKPYTRKPYRAVHDVDAAAGGRPQAAVLLRAHHEHRAAAVRERLHHLHAYRLDDAVGVGHQRRAQPGRPALRPGVRAPDRRASTPAR